VRSYSFHGGVHPPEYKELTENRAFEIIPLPEKIILPLSQHLGKELTSSGFPKDSIVIKTDGTVEAKKFLIVTRKCLWI
jgi:Na+-translocating ferredoxin:NAD+ oxidoreductase RnfC subunit